MKAIKLNIAIKPSADVVSEAMRIVSDIEIEREPVFSLDNINFLPHITIYYTEFPEESLDSILKEVDKLAKETKTFKLDFTSIETNKGFLGIRIESTEEFIALHQNALNLIPPLRGDHVREKHKESHEYFKSLDEKRKENVKKYGNPEVDTLFRPHLTMALLDSPGAAEMLAESIVWRINEMKVDTIAVYTMGEHGTCKQIVKEFPIV